jgi:hypothetical protein
MCADRGFAATETGSVGARRLRNRILALLACLRHPSPPPLLVVEEIENGLDPQTINLLVEELRAAINAKKTQGSWDTTPNLRHQSVARFQPDRRQSGPIRIPRPRSAVAVNA